MTKKDYELIANRINEKVTQAKVLSDYHNKVEDYSEAKRWAKALSSLKELAWSLDIDLKRDNPRFNRNRFLEACGVAA